MMKEILSLYTIPLNTKLWMVRTQAGRYYDDFKVNNFIALGWNKISLSQLNQIDEHNDKISYIKKLYPNESRPGLILSQIETFTEKMVVGDYVVIPAVNSKTISIGKIIGPLDYVTRYENDGFEQCDFQFKIAVNWIREISTVYDIYLLKVLGAIQTISDITKHSDLVFRNLYDVYAYKEKLHVTLKKDTFKPCYLNSRFDFDHSLVTLSSELFKIYGEKEKRIQCKTAISSPGFYELIQDISPAAVAFAAIIGLFVGNKFKDGEITLSGISALLKSISDLFNDKEQRKLTNAQTNKVNAETRKINAESKKIELEIFRKEKQCLIQSQMDGFLPQEQEKRIESLQKEAVHLNSAAKEIGITGLSSND